MRISSPSTRFTGAAVWLAVGIGAQPASAQTAPAGNASAASTASNARVVVHVYAEPSVNRMGEWRARIDDLKADAAAQRVPISGEAANGFLAWGGTLLVRLTPRVFVGGEGGMVLDQNRFVVTEPIGGIFPGSGEFEISAKTLDRNAEVVLALFPREESYTHVQFGAGIGHSHLLFASRQSGAEGQGTGPIFSALVGKEWRMFYLVAGARIHRMPINYSGTADPGRPGPQGFPRQPDVDLSGVFVRVGLAFRWFSD
jgi:hypothetical protein